MSAFSGATAIDTRLLVNVDFEVIPVTGSSIELPSMVFTRSDRVPIRSTGMGLIRFYGMEDVAAYFGGTSDEYQFARVFFSGERSSASRPRDLTFVAYPDEARLPWILGSRQPELLSVLHSIANGEFSIAINGTANAITPLNLATTASYSEIAALLQSAIRAASTDATFSLAEVEYDPYMKAFRITAGGDGADGQSISQITGNLAEALGVASSQNPVTSYGISAQEAGSITATLLDQYSGFSLFTTIWEATPEEVAAFAQMQAASGIRFLYFPWTYDTEGYVADPDSQLGVDYLLASMESDSPLQYANLENAVFDGYGYTTGSIYSAFAMTIGSSINTNNADQFALPTWHCRRQAGIPYNVTRTSLAQTLFKKRVNFYGNWALDQEQFRFFAEGATMGEWRYIDHYVAGILLKKSLEYNSVQLLRNARKIPPNNTGREMIYAAGNQSATWAINNGLAQKGITLDDVQQSIAITQSGSSDIVEQLFTNGIYIIVPDVSPVQRRERRATAKCWWVYGGSVHFLDWQVKAFQ